jgi:hypothetical protein
MRGLGVLGLAALSLWAIAHQVVGHAAVDMVSVKEHGAVGDGEADDTQALLDAVAEGRASGRHVYVPRGRYRISQTVALENIGITGPDTGAWPADIDALPSVLPVHTGSPAFALGAGASLKAIDITCGLPAEVEAGPPAVLISGIGVFISNCRIRYPWDGIITDGKSNVGRLNIHNVFIVSPRNVGVRVTGTWDVPALRNIEVWNAGPVPRGLNEGIGFHLGKNDLIRLTDCFAFAMRHGFLLEDKIEGCEIAGGTWGVMTGCSTDFCGTGIAIRGQHTVSISGGTFWDHAESLVVEGEGARVRVSAAELKSNGAPSVVVKQCDHTVVTGCSILRPMETFDAPAVVFEGGRLVLGDNFVQSRGPGVRIGPDVAGGIVRGNLIESLPRAAIVREGEGQKSVLVEGNLEQEIPARTD